MKFMKLRRALGSSPSRLTTNSLLKNSTCVLRQAQHERETLIGSMLFSLILRLSKDEQRVFQQTAKHQRVSASAYAIRIPRCNIVPTSNSFSSTPPVKGSFFWIKSEGNSNVSREGTGGFRASVHRCCKQRNLSGNRELTHVQMQLLIQHRSNRLVERRYFVLHDVPDDF
jgi:hypothetical protein